MAEKFIEYLKNNGLAENTCKSYNRDVELFKEYYKDSYGEELDKLVHADVLMYYNHLLNKGLTSTSVNRKIASLKKYNLFLIDDGVQDNIVIIDKDYIKIQPSMISKTIPSIQEINKLKHFASRDTKNAKRDYCFISIFIYGGLRESEIVTLRISDIKLEERFINIIGKGKKFRQIVINNLMYDAISDYLEEREAMNINSPYLFVGQKSKNNGGKPLNRNFCNRLLNKYKSLCNIESLHPHLLRAFFCSNALHNAGYSIDQVANQAGHSSLNTTKRYLVTDKEDLKALANKL